jgi:hypothetical protein
MIPLLVSLLVDWRNRDTHTFSFLIRLDLRYLVFRPLLAKLEVNFTSA